MIGLFLISICCTIILFIIGMVFSDLEELWQYLVFPALVLISVISLLMAIEKSRDHYYKQGNIDGMRGWYYYKEDTTKSFNYDNFKLIK